MSWLQVYEVVVPHYEVRNGKYVFALQLQRYRGNNNNNNNAVDTTAADDWNDQQSSSHTTTNTSVTSYVTALRSYSQFRTLWKELLRATKTTITTASPLAHDGRAAFARRNRQTRQRLWSHPAGSDTQLVASLPTQSVPLASSTSTNDNSSNSSTAAESATAAAMMASPLGSGACPCSSACCPFARLHWVLKSYPFPPRRVLTRSSPAVLEERRHALEQFVATLREFFTGFPRSFLHSVDATERCRVLALFAAFIGFSDELRSMAISRSPLRVAAWKAELLLSNGDGRAPSHAALAVDSAMSASNSTRSLAAARSNSARSVATNRSTTREQHRFSTTDKDDDSDVANGYETDDETTNDDGDGDAFEATVPTVYVPSLRPLPEDVVAPSDGFPVLASAERTTREQQQRTRSVDHYNSNNSVEHGRDSVGAHNNEKDDTDDEDVSDSSVTAAPTQQYARGSSVYILGRPTTRRRTQPSLPKLTIRSATVKTLSSFLVDFRDHLLAQFSDVVASVDSVDDLGDLDDARRWELALYLACQIGQLYAVQSIVARGTDPNLTVSDGTTPVHAASRAGHCAVVRVLVAGGADVNVTDRLGMTPLLLAINHGDRDVVRLLLDSGADVNRHNARRVSAAHVAVACQSFALLRLLLEYDAFVNTANAINGKTPLHIAAETGNYHICELLLNSGANVHQRTASGCDAYGLAVAHGHVNVAALCRAFQSHSQRRVASREQLQLQYEQQQVQQSQRQSVVEITPLRQSILRTTMTMAADACGAHDAVRIVAQDGHSYAVL